MMPRHMHGPIPTHWADEYMRLMKDAASLRDIATPANLGAWRSEWREGNVVYTQTVTVWQDLSAAWRYVGDSLRNDGSSGDILCSLEIARTDGESVDPMTLESLIAERMIESVGGFSSRRCRSLPPPPSWAG